MKLALNRRHILIIAAALALALAAYSWQQYHIQYPNREHHMTEFTKNMKTVCFGRYLIDIPVQSEFSIGNTIIDDVKVEYSGAAPNESLFQEKIKERETALRVAKHDTEGTRLREALDINEGKHRLLVYRGNEFSTRLTWVETMVRSGNDEWKISNDASEKYVADTKKLVTRLAAELQPCNVLDIPSTPGACIKNGVITGSNYEAEDVTASTRMQTPEFSVTITSETSGPRERGQTLWDRMDKSEKMIKEVYGVSLPIGVIRRADVTVDGRKGQEYISITPEKGMETFIAKAEIYGDSTPRKPTFKIEMDASWTKSPSQAQKKSMLSKEDALALWDTILKSIRPRPGAF